MSIVISSYAEEKATLAEGLPAFGSLKLIHVKRAVADLLALIGRDGIFDEYTVHNINHIDAMLRSLDWIIPEKTKELMTPAEWLLIVLSVYFHDLGMLVTKKEFDNRYSSSFIEYRDKVLFDGDAGVDYKHKVLQLPEVDSERFLYQEFVREKHAERIRAWVIGRAVDHLGVTPDVVREVNGLLDTLGPQFRRDLALVCESHHLNDLNDFKKYKVSQPYGNSDAETANVQYAAILLRTADLLHITSDRTPSAVFRVINPSDPVSQREWAKQAAVTRVRPKVALDEEGNPNPDLPKDTIEVHAYFQDENGFFGLTSYLSYADEQLRKSYDWVQAAIKTQAAKYDFPWKRIDQSNIEAEGFLRRPFEFELDQTKILDLLTGHTLYNDMKIVLRELVQNSIDAIRLQRIIDGNQSQGRILVHWDSQGRVLTVQDNGTGMTQETIEKHLLKVGSSRYQDPEFRKNHPNFSPISRFGIGVLSTFMIADAVEISTCSTEEDQARQLSLRSVHGKYLVRLLDKHDTRARAVFPHGTVFKLSIRQSVDMSDIVDTLSKWIVIPNCGVLAQVDNGTQVKIGFSTPKEAVEHQIAQLGLNGPNIKVEQREQDGITVAYAVRWSEYFRQWGFISNPSVSDQDSLLGTCVEGVRVEFDTPGYRGKPIWAIANAVGPQAPRTNVARSGLETSHLDPLLDRLYTMYCAHVETEVKELHQRRGFSLTWATHEAQYLLAPLIDTVGVEFVKGYARHLHNEPISERLLWDAITRLPIFLLEDGHQRHAASAKQLHELKSFWTLDGNFITSAESLLREVNTKASLSGLVTALQTEHFDLPDEPILSYYFPNAGLFKIALTSKTVDTIRIHKAHRRVDLRWSARDVDLWQSLPNSLFDPTGPIPYDDIRAIFQHLESTRRKRSDILDLKVGQPGIVVQGNDDEVAVRTLGNDYVLPGTLLADYLTKWLARLRADNSLAVPAVAVFALIKSYLEYGRPGREEGQLFDDWPARIRERIRKHVDIREFTDVINGVSWKVFNPAAWRRGSED